MEFMDAYKRLEKLCGEILNDERRISAYIEEMERLPRGAYCVRGWSNDLKQLKHYRWVRNQIVHNPGCSEENMCGYSDTQWLLDFHSRIMKQTDPLTLYRKATQPNSESATNRSAMKTSQPDTCKQSNNEPVGCSIFLLCAILIIVIVFAAIC